MGKGERGKVKGERGNEYVKNRWRGRIYLFISGLSNVNCIGAALDCCGAAIDGDDLAGDVARGIGGEQAGEALEVFVIAQSAQWRALDDALADLFERGARHLGLRVQVAQQRAQRQGVEQARERDGEERQQRLHGQQQR